MEERKFILLLSVILSALNLFRVVPFATKLDWARSLNMGRGSKYQQLIPEEGKKSSIKS